MVPNIVLYTQAVSDTRRMMVLRWTSDKRHQTKSGYHHLAKEQSWNLTSEASLNSDVSLFFPFPFHGPSLANRL